MGTTLGSKTATIPSLKLRSVGDHADFYVVDIDENLPRYEYGTGEVRLSRSGKPQTQHRLVVEVAGGAGVVTENEQDRPARQGEVVAIYVAGRDKWDPDLDRERKGQVGRSWGAALHQLDGGLQCGDFGRWRFEAEVPGQGAQPRKVRTFQLRHPKPAEADAAKRCEALLVERRQPTHTPVGGTGGGYGDEEPF